jgi:hypothetical protein
MEPGGTGKINDLHLYKAVNRVLAYRLLDVCQWVKSEKPSLDSATVPATVPALDGTVSALVERQLLEQLVCPNTFFIFLGQLPPF